MKVGKLILAIGWTACSVMVGCSNGDRPAKAEASTDSPIRSATVSESPRVQKVTFRSEALGKDMRFNVYLPPDYDSSKRYPVLYLIHGYTGDEDDWMPGLGIDEAAEELLREGKIDPLIIVSPQIDNSYGFNSASEGNYGDYIDQDLIPYVDDHFSTMGTKEGRYIGGLSMGGWVALYHAFAHPELFSKAGGHSPAIWMDDWADTGGLKNWIYPTEEARKLRDPYWLADTADLSGMSVYLDCGDEDSYKFYEGAEALNAKLQSKGVRSEYHPGPGGHDGEYWSGHAKDYLLFYAGKS